MSVNYTIADRQGLLKLLAQGRIAEAEILLRNNAHLRAALLHLPGLRHTEFFKRRLRFYREFARANGMENCLSVTDRQTLRNEFAHSHCMTHALRQVAQAAADKLDMEGFQRRMVLMRLQRIRRRRQRLFGLF